MPQTTEIQNALCALQKRRVALQRAIIDAINHELVTFEQETGVMVAGIEIGFIDNAKRYGTSTRLACTNVHIELNI